MNTFNNRIKKKFKILDQKSINLNFMHPINGKFISITIDNTMTGGEIISELIANDFILANSQGYELTFIGGNLLGNNNVSPEKTNKKNTIRSNEISPVKTEVINVNFMHPTDGRVISVTLDDIMTGQQIVSELIANDFVPACDDGYNLVLKGAHQLDNTRTLSQNSIQDNDTIRIIPATDGC
ncbi:hypothetical protein KORDIASMS9_04657 [Kordia sp. SMS9]|uniref:hypothetical protein n=1 Tax=Kordia sp. SMS9 TaxID=2282170 RepID=UPI000E0D5557|nr:hypothetical protein [Kordia sp. SMS9]AXG72385.1 hypothetical protein KORDIASMS9_04657 [Kordia sp. SMS9]